MKKVYPIALSCLLTLGSLPASGQGYSGGGAPYEHRSDEPSGIETSFTYELSYFSFPELEEQLSQVEPGLFRSHPLEEEVAVRLQLFEETYTHYSEPAPGAFTGSRVISKPVIYQAIYRIERAFRKQVRTAESVRDETAAHMCRILDTALILYHYDTGELEEAIKNADSVDELLMLFSRIRLIG